MGKILPYLSIENLVLPFSAGHTFYWTLSEFRTKRQDFKYDLAHVRVTPAKDLEGLLLTLALADTTPHDRR